MHDEKILLNGIRTKNQAEGFGPSYPIEMVTMIMNWDSYMGIIMRTSAALVLTWVLLPLNQLSSSFAAGCTGLLVCRLMASLPRNMAFPPKLVEVRLLLKLPSSSLGSKPKDKSERDIDSFIAGGVQRGL